MMDKSSFEAINTNGSSALLIACDYASSLIPDALSGLGLNADYLRQHIAFDIGARQVAILLAEFFRLAIVTG